MRHRVAGHKLSRTSPHRTAMRRNIVSSLIEHETISTTIQKAKEVKPFAEKLITLAKKGDLAARRRAISLLGDRDILNEDGEKEGTVIGKLFSDLGPRYLDRPGGYTRIIHVPIKRLGDNGQVVLLQLLDEEEKMQAGVKKAQKAEKESHPQEEEAQANTDQEKVEAAEPAEQEQKETSGKSSETEDKQDK